MNAALSMKYDLRDGKARTGLNIRSLLPSEDGYVHRVSYEEDRDPMEVLQENLQYVQEHQSPIVVGLDTFHLPYASNAGKNHAKHTAILCGWDEKNGKVELIDWYPPWYFKGGVDLKDYLLARSSNNESDGTIYSGRRIGNNWAAVEGIEPKSKKELLLELLQTTKQEYYREGDGQYLYGPEAMEAMKKMVAGCMDQEGFHSLHKEIWFIGKRYKFFNAYLQNFTDGELKDRVEAVMKNVNGEADEWDRMLMLAAKGCIVPSERVREKINARIDNLLLFEQETKRSFDRLEEQLMKG